MAGGRPLTLPGGAGVKPCGGIPGDNPEGMLGGIPSAGGGAPWKPPGGPPKP